ncbi:MAG: hypothetical protein JNJ78_10210 [Anaerolineae bacterium]|nr:hypothetical protein [Anaerolineae bacterium]
MGFNRKDLQDDDDFNFGDDDFKFDDEPNGDEFKFDDEPADIVLDDDKDAGFGFEGEDMPDIDEEPAERQGTNRTFIFLAGAMILLFLIGLGAVLFLATRDTGPTPIEQTRAAIETQNAETERLLNLTQTAAVVIAQNQTATASVPTATPTASPTLAPPTVTPTPVPPTVDATQAFANALLTQTAREATETAVAALITPTQEPINADTVALTATALAAILNGAGGGDVPTQEVLTTPGQVVTVIPNPTALPDTGLFDDLGGGSNAGLMALMALALVGVIAVSRVVRTSNKT